MDLSSMLPLLLGNNKGGNTDQMNMIMSMLNKNNGSDNKNNTSNTTQNDSNSTNNSNNMNSDLLKNLGSQSGINPALLSMLSNRNNQGSSSGPDLVNIMNMVNSNRTQQRKASGLKPIKDIVPNDILGNLVKYFNT